MTTKTLATVAAVVLAIHTIASPAAQSLPPALMFRFESDEFWLNLHHFLYVLARAEAGTADASRAAVAGAPAEAERGVKSLSAEERQTWAAAVTAYAGTVSRGDAIRDEPVRSITAALAMADDVPRLSGIVVDAAAAETLTRAAPIYRKAWWPAHRAANRAWQSSIQGLVDRHGTAILGFLTNAYGLEWPAGGFPVHLSGYANWAGAYSSTRGVLVVSSLYAGNRDMNGLEAVFHEGMHQWDNQVFSMLNAQARTLNLVMPIDLPHALIFFTAGEAVRRVEPNHVPLVEGVWKLSLSGSKEPAERLKRPLEEIWKPYLDGRGTRDEAFAALLAKVGIVAAAK